MAAEYNLGTAHGRVVIEADTKGIQDVPGHLDNVTNSGEKAGASLRKVSTGLLLVGGAILAGIGLAVKTAAEFETGLSSIQAVTSASAEVMDTVRAKALQLGKDTVFSASEASDAMLELVKAGLTVEETLNGAADATVALAAAGGVGMAEAATIMSNAKNQFEMDAKDLVSIADSIAGAANASAIDVSQFGMSLSQVGAVAHIVGVDFNDTAVAIAEMGNAGIVGSDAGTSLKAMFLRLNPQTKQAREEMMKLGLVTADGTNNFYDQAGSVRPLSEVQAVLANSLKGLTNEQKQASLNIIFGTDAIRAAAVMSINGAKGFDTLNTAMHATTAAEVAAKRMDNVQGSIEQMKGSAETLAINLGSVLLPALRLIVDNVTSLVNVFMEMPSGVQSTLVVLALLTGALLLAGGATIKAVTFAREFRDTWSSARPQIEQATKAVIAQASAMIATAKETVAARTAQLAAGEASSIFGGKAQVAGEAVRMLGTKLANFIVTAGPYIAVFALIGAAVALYMANQQAAQERTDAFTAALKNQQGSVQGTAEAVAQSFLKSSTTLGTWAETMNIVGLSTEDFVTAVLQGPEAVQALQNKITETGQKMGPAFAGPMANLSGILGDVNNSFSNSVTEMNNTAEAAAIAAGAVDPLTGQLKKTGDAADGTAASLGAVVGGLDRLKAALTQTGSMDKYQQDLNNVDNNVKKMGTSLVGTGDKAIANRDLLRGMFGDIGAAAEAWGKRFGKSGDEVNAKAAEMSLNLKNKLVDNGFKEADVKKFMGKLEALPDQINTVTTDVQKILDPGMRKTGETGSMSLAQGLTLGIPRVHGAGKDVGQAAVDGAKEALDSHSPSKVFIKLGGDVVDGFNLGLVDLKGVGKNIKTVLDPAIAASQKTINDWVKGQKDKLDEAIRKWQDYRKQVTTAMLGNVSLSTAFTDTKDQEENVKSAQKEFDAQKKTFDTNVGGGGTGDAASLEASRVALEAAKAAAHTFNENLHNEITSSQTFGGAFIVASDALAKQFTAGSPIWQMLTDQILQMGPGPGTELAQNLAQGLDSGMAAELKDWYAWGGDVGKSQADKNFGAGVENAENQFKGLEAKVLKEQKRLNKIGADIGAGVIVGFKSKQGAFGEQVENWIEELHKKWDINSPSRVSRGVGQSIAEGIVMGVYDGMPAIASAFDDMVRIPVGASGSLDFSAGAAQAARAYAGLPASSSVSGPSTTVLQARVFVGNQEITDIVRTELETADGETMSSVLGGSNI